MREDEPNIEFCINMLILNNEKSFKLVLTLKIITFIPYYLNIKFKCFKSLQKIQVS